MLQTFNVPAGGRQANAKADFFRYEAAGVGGIDETLRVRADGQDLGTYLPGDSIKLPIDASTWELKPANASQTAVVRLGLGSVESARLIGTVNVIDGGRSRTLVGEAIFASYGLTVAAGFLAAIQIINPIGSTKRLVLKKITMTTDIANVLRIGRMPQSGVLENGPVNVRSKLVGPAAAVAGAQIYYNALAAIPGAFEQFYAYTVGANAVLVNPFEEPLVIPEGEGIALMPNVGAQTSSLIAEGFVE